MRTFKLSLLFLFLSSSCLLFSQVVINELDIANHMVELKNLGASPADVSNYRLCNFPNYPSITELLVVSGSTFILPGELVLLQVPALNLSGVDDELGLYLPTGAFTSTSSILDYIEWGSSPHTRSGTAVGAGTWTTGNFIPIPLPGQTINYDGSGNTSQDYYYDDPSLGSQNNTPTTCSAQNFNTAANGLWADQSTLNGTRTTLKWNHYSDASDGCIIEGALTDGVNATSPFMQVLVEGNLINGDVNGFDKSPNLGPSSAFTVFNPSTYPNGQSRNLTPGADYMWRVRCGCVINNTLPLPQRLSPSNLHLSPWSGFEFFTNLGAVEIESNDASTKALESKVLIFPNPAKDIVQIDLNALDEEVEQMILINALGEIVRTISLTNSKGSLIRIETAGLESGIYVLKTQSSTTEWMNTVIISR